VSIQRVRGVVKGNTREHGQGRGVNDTHPDTHTRTKGVLYHARVYCGEVGIQDC
jgi:hypothetical protein